MINRQELVSYLHQYLSCDDFNDYAPNGLQVEGDDAIQLVCTAVTASTKVIEEAVRLKANALLVHHGFFWRGEKSVITGIKRQRIGALLHANMSLLAYHLPLDCHLIVGNNACLGKLFPMITESIQSHTVNNNSHLLWSGELEEAKSVDELKTYFNKIFERIPLHLASNTDSSKAQYKTIKKIAWCTGAAQDFIEEAKALGVDAYISGEVSERTFYQAEELDIHYFACGHHATERFGIQALGVHLAEKFDLKHQFIDCNNPV